MVYLFFALLAWAFYLLLRTPYVSGQVHLYNFRKRHAAVTRCISIWHKHDPPATDKELEILDMSEDELMKYCKAIYCSYEGTKDFGQGFYSNYVYRKSQKLYITTPAPTPSEFDTVAPNDNQ